MLKRIVLSFSIFCFLTTIGMCQMERERVVQEGALSETFWSTNLVGMGTVETLPHKNLNVTIMHNFGLINIEPLHNFFGLDFGATVRLGLDYGITENWSMGVGRTSPQKLYDFRTTVSLLDQTTTGQVPVSMAVKGDLGINTGKNGLSFNNRLNYLGSLMVARKFNDQLSLQVAPMFAHFNNVFSAGEKNSHFALGIGGEYHLSDRWAIMAEYYPVLGERSEGTRDAFAFGVNIETGGHVFQLFFKTSNWHTEQHIIAQNDEDFLGGDFRFGFNVNRIFWLGDEDR